MRRKDYIALLWFGYTWIVAAVTFEIALTILGTVFTVSGLVGSLSNAFRFLLLLKSGVLREYPLRLAIARICKRLATEAMYLTVLLVGLSLVARSVWHKELHAADLWSSALILAGLGIYTIGYFSEKLSSRSQ